MAVAGSNGAGGAVADTDLCSSISRLVAVAGSNGAGGAVGTTTWGAHPREPGGVRRLIWNYTRHILNRLFIIIITENNNFE